VHLPVRHVDDEGDQEDKGGHSDSDDDDHVAALVSESVQAGPDHG
jgi:hypothetical protein